MCLETEEVWQHEPGSYIGSDILNSGLSGRWLVFTIYYLLPVSIRSVGSRYMQLLPWGLIRVSDK